MAAKRNALIKTLQELIADIDGKIPILQAYLFGSYARGNPHRWSDIDVALVSPKFSGVRFLDVKRLLPFLRDYSNFIEIHPFPAKNFNPGNLFAKEIIRSGIKIK